MIKSEDFMIYSLLMVDQAYSFNRENYGGGVITVPHTNESHYKIASSA